MVSPDRFDGVEIDKHQARFAGTIELDPTDADRLGIDTEAMAVVVFRVAGASVDENSAGDLIRTNKFKVRQVAVIRDKDVQEELYKKLSNLDAPHPTLFDEPTVLVRDDEPPADVDPETGEIFDTEEGIDEDDVFTPGGPQRIKVGGARENDETLRRFLEAGSV